MSNRNRVLSVSVISYVFVLYSVLVRWCFSVFVIYVGVAVCHTGLLPMLFRDAILCETPRMDI